LLAGGFSSLADAMLTLQRPGDSVLTLTLGSVFASRWLIRRLPHFIAAQPQIELRMVATGKLIDLARSDIDCAIRYGEGQWPDVRAEPLGCRAFSPVAAPDLAAKLKRPGDLTKVPVIEDQATMLSWPRWFEAAGGKPLALSGPRYSDPALAYEAAIAGQGVLMAVDRMSESAVREGQLLRPFAASAQSPYDYYFVTSTLRRVPRKVTQFRDWLMSEIET
jgi:DNA-binding transcriptional LysR family regulator